MRIKWSLYTVPSTVLALGLTPTLPMVAVFRRTWYWPAKKELKQELATYFFRWEWIELPYIWNNSNWRNVSFILLSAIQKLCLWKLLWNSDTVYIFSALWVHNLCSILLQERTISCVCTCDFVIMVYIFKPGLWGRSKLHGIIFSNNLQSRFYKRYSNS